MLSLQARMDLGVIARRNIPHSSKLQHHWNLTIKLLSVMSRTLFGGGGGGGYHFAEKLSLYSTAPVNWTKHRICIGLQLVLFLIANWTGP